MGLCQKSLNKKRFMMELPHESFLFWRFDFNKAKTCAKSQFVPLNQKLTVMPKSGTMVNFQLMLANYPIFGTLSFLILFTQWFPVNNRHFKAFFKRDVVVEFIVS